MSVTGTTAVAHQALTFGTATDGACVCVCVPCFLGERTRNSLKRGARMLRRWAGRYKPTLTSSGFQKQPRSHGCSQHQQRYGSRTTAPALQTDLCGSHGAFGLICVCSFHLEMYTYMHSIIIPYIYFRVQFTHTSSNLILAYSSVPGTACSSTRSK